MSGNEGMVYVQGGTYEGEQIRALYIDQHEFANEDHAKVAGVFQLASVNTDRDTVEIVGTGKAPTVLWEKYAQTAPNLQSGVAGYVLKLVSDLPPLRSTEGFNDPKQPMVDVTGKEAKEICEAQGKRLLTPKEWAYVASHGGEKEYSTDDGTLNEGVPWKGDSTREVCSASGHYVEWNGKEVCDMSGNAQEWTYDPETETFFFSGGSWLERHPRFLRAAGRYKSDLPVPDNGYRAVGLRCAKDAV